MIKFILHLLRLASVAAAIFFLIVTISLITEGEVMATVLSAVITAVPALIFWATHRKLHKIAEAEAEEARWRTPKSYTLLVITEDVDDMDEDMEAVADKVFEMENVGSLSNYSIDEVREIVPNFRVDQYPTYMIVDDSPTENLEEMLSHIRAKGTDAYPLLQFLQEELWKHELKLRAGREGS